MKAKEFIKEYRDIDPLDDPNRGMDRIQTGINQSVG